MKGLADWIEELADRAATQVYTEWERRQHELGTRPLGQRPLTEREQLAEYMANLDNPAFFKAKLDSIAFGLTPESSRLRLRAYNNAMQKLYAKYYFETVGTDAYD